MLFRRASLARAIFYGIFLISWRFTLTCFGFIVILYFTNIFISVISCITTTSSFTCEYVEQATSSTTTKSCPNGSAGEDPQHAESGRQAQRGQRRQWRRQLPGQRGRQRHQLTRFSRSRGHASSLQTLRVEEPCRERLLSSGSYLCGLRQERPPGDKLQVAES